MAIVFRKLIKTDQATYRKTRLECLYKFPENFGSTYQEESLKPLLKFEQIIADEEVDSFMFGAFDENNCIGICGFLREDRLKAKHRGEIVQMYVHPAYAGRQIGSNLLAHTLHFAFQNAEIEQINLCLVAQNQAAYQLYVKAGFKEYGLVKNCFKKETQYWDLILMLLERSNYIHTKLVFDRDF